MNAAIMTHGANTVFNPLLRAQSLPEALVQLSKAKTGLFLVSGLRMPDLLIDLKKQACFLRSAVRRITDFFDDIVTVRILSDAPAWASASAGMPIGQVFGEVGPQTSAPAWSQGMQFHLKAYPTTLLASNPELYARMIDLCRAQYLSFEQLMEETGASVDEICKFLEFCKNSQILMIYRDDKAVTKGYSSTSSGLFAAVRSRFGMV